MREFLSPDQVKEVYEARVRKLAYAKWEEAGKPEGRDIEFWYAGEKHLCEKIKSYADPLAESALPNYT